MVTTKSYSRKICFSANLTCNLHCVYCYENKTNTDDFDVSFIKKQLSQVLSNRTSYGTLIKLHGGEPFLVFDKIKGLCEYLWQQDFEEKFLIRMTTNGTLIHGRIQNWLYENRDRISLKLSIDGNKDAHNLNRSGSYDKIDIPFFLSTWPNIEIKMTISPLSIQLLSKSVIELHSIGFNNISTSFAELVDWSSCNYPQILLDEINKLSMFYLTNPNQKKCSLFDVSFRNIDNKETVFHPCTINMKEAYDFHTGKRYPCHLYFESVCGKKTSEELCKIDLSIETNRVSRECKSCVFLNICHTCYAANYIARGATYNRDKAHCLLNRVRFLGIAYYYQSITANRGITLQNTLEDYRLFKDIQAIYRLIPYFNDIENEIFTHQK